MSHFCQLCLLFRLRHILAYGLPEYVCLRDWVTFWRKQKSSKENTDWIVKRIPQLLVTNTWWSGERKIHALIPPSYSYFHWLSNNFMAIIFNLYFCCSVCKLYLTLCDPLDCSTVDFPGLHYLPEFVQIHVHWVMPSHPLPHSSPFAFNLSQHQSLFQWGSSSHQVVKVLELQLYILWSH